MLFRLWISAPHVSQMTDCISYEQEVMLPRLSSTGWHQKLSQCAQAQTERRGYPRGGESLSPTLFRASTVQCAMWYLPWPPTITSCSPGNLISFQCSSPKSVMAAATQPWIGLARPGRDAWMHTLIQSGITMTAQLRVRVLSLGSLDFYSGSAIH